MGFVHLFGVFCLLAATVLLILVSIGLPVWKSIYFLDAAVSAGDHIRMGQWGVCVAGSCSKAKLGYDMNFIRQTAAGSTEAATAVVHGLSYALVLNPIAAGFTLLALLFAIGSHLILGILGSIFSFFAFLVTIVAFGIDLGLFVTAHRRLSNSGASVMYGPAFWMVVAAAALQLIASFTVCFTRNDNRNRHATRDMEARPVVNNGRGGWFARRRAANQGAIPPVMAERPVKRHFWQRNRAPVAAY